MAKRNFCDINPTFFFISTKKEIIKRHLKNIFTTTTFSKTIFKEKLPVVVFEKNNNLIKKAKGVDPVSQYNKAINIDLACKKINGMIIRPGEVFSFWKSVGNTTKKKGYKEGRIIEKNKLKPGIGGGLCNLSNTIHLLFLHSPLEVVEFHKHSDALAPDEGKRVPFSSGTSVSYNYIDYRVKNTTDQNVQILVWVCDEKLYGELRSEKEFPYIYELVEENHHFHKIGDKYYRLSKIYRNVIDKKTKEIIKKELILDNKSEVMYDYELIPKSLIK